MKAFGAFPVSCSLERIRSLRPSVLSGRVLFHLLGALRTRHCPKRSEFYLRFRQCDTQSLIHRVRVQTTREVVRILALKRYETKARKGRVRLQISGRIDPLFALKRWDSNAKRRKLALNLSAKLIAVRSSEANFVS